jgi:flagellar protein FlaJ
MNSKLQKINELLKEIETYSNYKTIIKQEVDSINKSYFSKKISQQKRDSLLYQRLKGRNEKQVMEQYDAYINYLKEQIRYNVSQVFYEVYYDKSVPLPGKAEVEKEVEKVKVIEKKIDKIEKQAPKKELVAAKEIVAEQEKVEQENIAKETAQSKKQELKQMQKNQLIEKESEKQLLSKKSRKESKIETKKPEMMEEPVDLLPEQGEEPEFLRKRKQIEAEQLDTIPETANISPEQEYPEIRTKKKSGFLVANSFMQKFGIKKKQNKKNKGFEFEVPEAIEKRLEQRTFLADKTEIPANLVELETLRKKAKAISVEMRVSPENLAQEAKKIGKMIEEKKPEKVYKPSKIGSISNLFVRKIGYYAVRKYPSLFENLYSVLRPANIGTLSNTYVNIIIFLSILATLVSGLFFFFFFLFFTYSFGELIVKSLLMSLLIGIVTMIVVYAYPFMKVGDRRKNINANLPFAVNHMSAIASSGLNPSTMFELIAQSEEYGEITVEVRKVVEYVKLFGHDLITAVDDVAKNTPSDEFKDLLEGMIATLQSGGDLKSYFNSKSKEILNNYQINQEKQIEMIDAYSDVYTGIMIAAPLFFISILSLVSILGGTIAGFSVQTIISAGTYLLIPLLNIGFLLFLQVSQPEI